DAAEHSGAGEPVGALDIAGQLVVAHVRDPLPAGVDIHAHHEVARRVRGLCGHLATGGQCSHSLEVETRHQSVIDQMREGGSVDADDARGESYGDLLVGI